MANRHYCSDGSRVTESTIKARYSQALREKHEGNPSPICEACGKRNAVDNSHVIAKSRCRQLHKTELIWNKLNFYSSCRPCHYLWENYKSGEFFTMRNIEEIMFFIKEHDPESYVKRMIILNEKVEEIRNKL